MEKYFSNLANQKTEYTEIPEFNPTGEFEGIKAITYKGAKIGEQNTKVFAYLGFPKDASNNVPAVVLVHGGGGVAFLPWVKMWNERGYAAIAMSNTGDFPTQINAGFQESPKHKELWQHGLHGIFCEENYTDIFENDDMKNTHKPHEQQWMYHAIASVISAHNILAQDMRVDSSKIGICGVSWGGVITSLTLGFDSRFAFAICIYGSGYLGQSHGWMKDRFGNTEEWLAETRFCNVNIPIFWLCWNSDSPFSINSNSKSYCHTVKNNENTRFSAVDKMGHSHACGWTRKECFAFADSVIKGSPRLPAVMFNDSKPVVINPDNVKITDIKVYYITDSLSYSGENTNVSMNQEWKCTSVSSLSKFAVPSNAKDFYIELTSEIEGSQYITTSEFIQADNT